MLYRIDPGAAVGPFNVRVELLYQTASFAFLRDLLAERSRAREIDRLARLLETVDQAPVVVAQAEISTGAAATAAGHPGGQP